MSLEQPDPNLPDTIEPSITQKEGEEEEEDQEEKQKKPQEQDPGEEEEDEEDSISKSKDKDKKIPVTEYGIKSGESACPVCQRAYKFFHSPKIKRFFNFKYADLLNEKHRKVADREGFDSMPFFKVKRPGNDKSEFIVGFNEVDFEEMMKEITTTQH